MIPKLCNFVLNKTNLCRNTTHVKHYLNSCRFLNSSVNKSEKVNKNLRSTVYYIAGIGVLCVGLSYAAVPLYRMFCQVNR